MIRQLRPALVLIAIFSVITGLIFPLGLVGVAGLAFPSEAGGGLITRDGKVIGSALIGQNFTSDRYFHPRPSATMTADPNDATKTIPAPYAADASAGSNLGPTSAALVERIDIDVAAWTRQGGALPVPPDAVTSSGSGLDPDISPATALGQVGRVATARAIGPARLRALVEAQIRPPLLGFIGAPHVNVLALNLALDGLGAP